MLEFYQAYAEGEDLMRLSEEMLSGLAREVTGGCDDAVGRRHDRLDAAVPAPDDARGGASSSRGTTRAARCGPRISTAEERLLAAAARFGVEKPERFAGKKGKLLAELFEAVAEPRLVQPTFSERVPDRDLAAVPAATRRTRNGSTASSSTRAAWRSPTGSRS